MAIDVVNLKEKFNKINELHKYKVAAQMNDIYFKLVKAKREFIWHDHPETDETFLVIRGEMKIELRDKTLVLREGEMAVIPRGVEHRPVCETEVWLMLIEPKETVNTGSAGGALTDNELEWI